jgi:hypothetical protein
MNMEPSMSANESNVSKLAYQLWEQAGRPAGRDLEFWLNAEVKLRQVAPSAAAPASALAKAPKATRPVKAGARKTWPKPYPSLPKF